MSKIQIVSPENPNGVVRDMTSEEQAQEDLKASAKAKLVAGEALTQEEADTIVL